MQVRCSCGKQLRVPDDPAVTCVRCPGCGQRVAKPSAAESSIWEALESGVHAEEPSEGSTSNGTLQIRRRKQRLSLSRPQLLGVIGGGALLVIVLVVLLVTRASCRSRPEPQASPGEEHAAAAPGEGRGESAPSAESERTTPIVPEDGLVARYAFDEGTGRTAHNAAAAGNDAIIQGAKYVKAAAGHALSFDGDDDYVRVNDDSALNISGSDLTVECWFKVKDPGAIWRGLCGNYHSGVGGYMLVYTSEGVAFYTGVPPGGPAASLNVNDGQWHHAAGVLNSGTMTLYLDGAQAQAGTPESAVKPSRSAFEIGRYNLGNAFSGKIDGVAVYNKALTATEIEEHYRNGQR